MTTTVQPNWQIVTINGEQFDIDMNDPDALAWLDRQSDRREMNTDQYRVALMVDALTFDAMRNAYR